MPTTGREFTGDASSSYGQTATALKTGMPFSISLWFQTDDLGQTGAVLAFSGRAANPTDYFALSVAGDKVRIEARTPSLNRAVDTINAFTAGTPHHVLGVWAATNDRRAYLDGDNTNKAAGSGSAVPAAATRFAVGARRDSTPDGGYVGAIAHLAFWGVALGATEAAALAAGAWPPDVDPDNLLAFYPLTGDNPEACYLGLGPDLVITGAATGTFQPPVTEPGSSEEEPPAPVVDGEVTTTTELGTPYSWALFPDDWEGLAAGKVWANTAPSVFTTTVDRTLGFAATRAKTIRRLTARSVAFVRAGWWDTVHLTARSLGFQETASNLVDWLNFFAESFVIGVVRPKTLQPAAHANSFGIGSGRTSRVTKNVLRALAFVEAASRQATYRRQHARSLHFADTSRREFVLTLAETLALVEGLLRNAGVVLHDLVVRGKPMDLETFKAFAARGPLGYTSKETLVPGDYKYQEAIVGVSVRAAATSGIAGILGLTLHVDVPDLRDRGEVELAAETSVVNFTKTFRAVPEVRCQTRAGSTPFYADVSEVTTSGFTVTLRQITAPSNIVAGTITWSATGW